MTMSRHVSRLLAGLMLALLLLGSSAEAAETRAMWLTRWYATNDAQIQAAVDYCVAHDLNTLLVQVYGDSYALYNSSVAPKSYLVTPSFDALQSAVTKGHAAGLEVHAYCNMFNAYSGGLGTPSNPAHLINSHPEWAMVDNAGRSMVQNVGTGGTFVFCNPVHAGYNQYLTSIAAEVATNYAIDGFHMDYIRFPGAEFDYGPVPTAAYQTAYGKAPLAGDPDWDRFRQDTVTDLVTDIYAAVHAVKPQAKVSAAVWNTAGSYFQDPYLWLEAGLLDSAYVMSYTSDNLLFEQFIRPYSENSGGREIVAGILADANQVGAQIDIARTVGVEGQCLFDYSTVTNTINNQFDARYVSATSPSPMPWLDGSADLVAPILSSIGTVGLTGTQARIVWHSDERTTSRVEYGPTTAYGLVATDATLVYDHDILLTGLAPSTTYQFRVVSQDAAGNSTTSANGSFATTSGGIADIIVDDGDTGYAKAGSWTYVSGAGAAAWNGDYWYTPDALSETAWSTWTPVVSEPGNYEVYAMWRSGANRVTNAPYTIVHNGGSQTVTANQQTSGGVWNLLGTYNFAAGSTGYVKVGNVATGGDVVIADAIRLKYVGTGGGDTTPPSAPTGLSATGGNAQVVLDWNNNSEADFASYTVLRSTTNGGPYSSVATGLTASAWTDTTVANGTTYHYVVRAIDTSSNASANSAQASATPNAPPSTMHVQSIVPSTVNAGGGKKRGRATVTIFNNAGAAVPNASVTVAFTGSFNETVVATTNSSGVATLTTVAALKGTVSFQACVTNATHASLAYNSGANVESCDGL